MRDRARECNKVIFRKLLQDFAVQKRYNTYVIYVRQRAFKYDCVVLHYLQSQITCLKAMVDQS